MARRPPLPTPETARRSATAHDVARLAGVSQSAVSRSFTQGASVSAETRRKVLEAASQIGYRPNMVARSLITRRSSIIGVAMAYLENQFYPSVLEALSDAFGQRGYQTMLFTSRHGESSDPILEDVLRHKVDALVMASASLSSRFDEECQQAGVPVILLNRRTESASISSVTTDNRAGAEAVAAFLAAGGHQHFAFLAGLDNSSTSQEREEGFSAWLATQGFEKPRRIAGYYDFNRAAEATRALLASKQRPDAIFCANDHMALAAINVARAEYGLDIGREISIVGFDNAGPASWPLFDLTTYAQPIQAMVERVVEIACEGLAEPGSAAQRLVLPGRLAVRRSARLPPGAVRHQGQVLWEPGSPSA